MVEKNVTLPVELDASAPPAPVGTATQQQNECGGGKRVKKSKGKSDTEPGVSGFVEPATKPSKDTVFDAEEQERKPEPPAQEEPGNASIDKHKRRRRRSPLPPIEHKRVVHYYREARPLKGKNHRGKAKSAKYDKKAGRDADRVDDYSDSDWEDFSDTDGSGSDSDADDLSDEFDDDDGHVARAPDRSKSSQHDTRDSKGKFAPQKPVVSYRVV